MSERVCIFRRIRVNKGTSARPDYEYFEEWDDGGWAWWTPNRAKAHRFSSQGDARMHLAELRQHLRGSRQRPGRPRIVAVMGLR